LKRKLKAGDKSEYIWFFFHHNTNKQF